jgi:hypothetical protein
MKLALLSITGSAFLLSNPASALEVESSVGIYYFSSSPEKIAAVQVERAEGGQVFHAERDPREVARDLAKQELAKGNLCLRQAERDLKAAVRSKLVSRMCREIFRQDVDYARAAKQADSGKLRADILHCEAAVDARETPGAVSLALTLRARIQMAQKLPTKLARAGFSAESSSQAPDGRAC